MDTSAIARGGNVAILRRVQTKHFPVILHELRTRGKKITHWIWWVFPYDKIGQSDRYETVVHNEHELLNLLIRLPKRVKQHWLDILIQLYRRTVVASLPVADFRRIKECSTCAVWAELKPRHVRGNPLGLKIRDRIRNYWARVGSLRTDAE